MGQHQMRRLELDDTLRTICPNVYFQPPASIRMIYPAIVYKRARIDNHYADNYSYIQNVGYEVTVIDRDPDSIIVEMVAQLPKCRYGRHFKADDLNHDTFYIGD